jgi:hypothetical protein
MRGRRVASEAKGHPALEPRELLPDAVVDAAAE